MNLNAYTVVIEASNATGDIWQAVAPSETVHDSGTALEVAKAVADNQTVADGDNWRVRVWHGEDADTGTEPVSEFYSPQVAAEPAKRWPSDAEIRANHAALTNADNPDGYVIPAVTDEQRAQSRRAAYGSARVVASRLDHRIANGQLTIAALTKYADALLAAAGHLALAEAKPGDMSAVGLVAGTLGDDAAHRMLDAPKAKSASSIDAYDIIEVSSDNGDYLPEHVGLIAVQRDGVLVAWAGSRGAAVAYIGRELGRPVRARQAESYFSGRRWTVVG